MILSINVLFSLLPFISSREPPIAESFSDLLVYCAARIFFYAKLRVIATRSFIFPRSGEKQLDSFSSPPLFSYSHPFSIPVHSPFFLGCPSLWSLPDSPLPGDAWEIDNPLLEISSIDGSLIDFLSIVTVVVYIDFLCAYASQAESL